MLHSGACYHSGLGRIIAAGSASNAPPRLGIAGPFPGRFARLDLVAFAVGVFGCYAAEKLSARNAGCMPVEDACRRP